MLKVYADVSKRNRNYKISVLADMVGYTSHTQLAINFKKKTGMNPSQYIAFLQKEENQK